MRKCAVYSRGNDIYVVSSAKNVFGIFQDAEPMFKLGRSLPPKELGEKVLEALEAYRENVPGRTYVRGAKLPPDPFLSFSGFKSWKAFEKGAQSFFVGKPDSEIEVIPGTPGREGGYVYQPDHKVRCAPDAEEIGRVLIEQASSWGHSPNQGSKQVHNAVQHDFDSPIPFGWQTAWFAVHSGDLAAIAAEIRLQDQLRVGWQQGLQAAAETDRIFISPEVRGWTFIIGNTLPFAPQEECLALLADLSVAFTEAQYFGNEKVTEYHAWAKATKGRLIRAYAFSGEQGAVLWDRGQITQEEIELDLVFPEADILVNSPDNSSVFQIAAKWSINPTCLEEYDLSSGRGLLGRPQATFALRISI